MYQSHCCCSFQFQLAQLNRPEKARQPISNLAAAFSNRGSSDAGNQMDYGIKSTVAFKGFECPVVTTSAFIEAVMRKRCKSIFHTSNGVSRLLPPRFYIAPNKTPNTLKRDTLLQVKSRAVVRCCVFRNVILYTIHQVYIFRLI